MTYTIDEYPIGRGGYNLLPPSARSALGLRSDAKGTVAIVRGPSWILLARLPEAERLATALEAAENDQIFCFKCRRTILRGHLAFCEPCYGGLLDRLPPAGPGRK